MFISRKLAMGKEGGPRPPGAPGHPRPPAGDHAKKKPFLLSPSARPEKKGLIFSKGSSQDQNERHGPPRSQWIKEQDFRVCKILPAGGGRPHPGDRGCSTAGLGPGLGRGWGWGDWGAGRAAPSRAVSPSWQLRTRGQTQRGFDAAPSTFSL